MRLVSLFSGIGAFEKSLNRLGVDFELVNFCEFDKFAIKSYCEIHGEDESKNLGDITKVDFSQLPKDIDMITHGSPCQDFSVAGNGKGAEVGSGTRSSLMWNSVQIISTIRPKYVVWENVKNVLSKKHRHNFDKYLDTMQLLGYTNYYQVLNGKDYGIPQNRERIFCISILGEHKPFEFPQKQELKLRLKDMLENTVDEKYYIAQDKVDKLIVRLIKDNKIDIIGNECEGLNVLETLRGTGSPWDSRHEAICRVYGICGISPTVTAGGGGGIEPKVMIETPCIVASRGRNVDNPSDRTVGAEVEQRLEPNAKGLCNTITSVQKDNYVLDCVGSFDKEDINDNERQRRVYSSDGISPSILARADSPKVITVGHIPYPNSDKKHQSNCVISENGICSTIDTCTGGNREPKIFNNYRVRKLTPLECFRLMGFDDEDYYKAEKVNSNSQLYKQAGNSIIVNVLDEIFRKLLF